MAKQTKVPQPSTNLKEITTKHGIGSYQPFTKLININKANLQFQKIFNGLHLEEVHSTTLPIEFSSALCCPGAHQLHHEQKAIAIQGGENVYILCASLSRRTSICHGTLQSCSLLVLLECWDSNICRPYAREAPHPQINWCCVTTADHGWECWLCICHFWQPISKPSASAITQLTSAAFPLGLNSASGTPPISGSSLPPADVPAIWEGTGSASISSAGVGGTSFFFSSEVMLMCIERTCKHPCGLSRL